MSAASPTSAPTRSSRDGATSTAPACAGAVLAAGSSEGSWVRIARSSACNGADGSTPKLSTSECRVAR